MSWETTPAASRWGSGDLSKWRNVPSILMAAGGLLALLGFFVNREQFAYSWLLAFAFHSRRSVGQNHL